MIAKVVRIGNSKGIRIPKPLLEQCEISESVNLQVEGNRIVLTPAKQRPRQGWEEAAKRMREAGDDELLIPDVLPDDPEVEW
jgi:antitoxin MazE